MTPPGDAPAAFSCSTNAALGPHASSNARQSTRSSVSPVSRTTQRERAAGNARAIVRRRASRVVEGDEHFAMRAAYRTFVTLTAPPPRPPPLETSSSLSSAARKRARVRNPARQASTTLTMASAPNASSAGAARYRNSSVGVSFGAPPSKYSASTTRVALSVHARTVAGPSFPGKRSHPNASRSSSMSHRTRVERAPTRARWSPSVAASSAVIATRHCASAKRASDGVAYPEARGTPPGATSVAASASAKVGSGVSLPTQPRPGSKRTSNACGASTPPTAGAR
mmetsp:Transcript_8774/g.36780  ORF Transcript_8774/g.36780 Transcript_8774/m.36780 type:complete len:283 (-) Transcript_8774:875-1723(-)